MIFPQEFSTLEKVYIKEANASFGDSISTNTNEQA